MRRPTPAEARAALWTLRAVREARRGIRRSSLAEIVVSPAPPLPDTAVRGVFAVLSRWEQTCLVRALVLQRWYASRGRPQELVIGVTAPSAGFKAHAWLAGDDPCHHDEFTELLRMPSPAGR